MQIAGSTPGPPPDVVALFTGQNSVGGVAASGAFFVQETGSLSETSSGVYLSHKCVQLMHAAVHCERET